MFVVFVVEKQTTKYLYPRNSYRRCNEPRPLVHAYT